MKSITTRISARWIALRSRTFPGLSNLIFFSGVVSSEWFLLRLNSGTTFISDQGWEYRYVQNWFDNICRLHVISGDPSTDWSGVVREMTQDQWTYIFHFSTGRARPFGPRIDRLWCSDPWLSVFMFFHPSSWHFLSESFFRNWRSPKWLTFLINVPKNHLICCIVNWPKKSNESFHRIWEKIKKKWF